MTLVARNIVANAAGAAVSLAVMLLALPVYLRLLGPEGYGLVGLFGLLAAASTAADVGLSATLNREVARFGARPDGDPAFADVAVTLQACCWAVGAGGATVLALAAPVVATHWLDVSALPAAQVSRSLLLMSAALPAFVARNFYLAGLNGRECQVLANGLVGTGMVSRAIVTVAALWLVAATPAVFFTVQAALLYAEAVVLGAAFWRALPSSARRGRVRPGLARPLLGFGLGVAGTMMLGLGLTSVDQLILSTWLPLAEFGYYSLAVALAASLSHLVAPVATAVYPTFSRAVAAGGGARLASEYHRYSQLAAVLVLPVGCLLAFFPHEVLAMWTRDPEAAAHAGTVLGLRAIGSMLNALMYVPHAAQLAFGWSALGVRINACALAGLIPATMLLAVLLGGTGAAMAWVALNVLVLGLGMRLMHARILPGELARWYARLGVIALTVAAIVALARLAMPETLGGAGRTGWILASGVSAAAGAVAAAIGVRRRRLAIGLVE